MTKRKASPDAAAIAHRAVAYVRVSTEEQAAEGVSLDAQEARIRAYCTLHGLELVQLYRDPGVSGGKPLAERDEGGELLALIARGEVQHVVALKLDRLFRNAIDAQSTAEAWERAGVAMHLIDMGGQTINTRSAAGKFLFAVLAAAAEMERNLIGERTSAALRHKRERGERLGTTPLGFTTPEPGAPMQPLEAELAVVRRILGAKKRGYSFRAIARRLDAEGIRTKRGGKWHHTTIRSVWRRRARYDGLF